MKAEWLAGWLTAVYDSSPDTPLICIQPHHCSLHYTPSPCGEWRYELWEIKIPIPAARHIIKQARLNKQTATEGENFFFAFPSSHSVCSHVFSSEVLKHTPTYLYLLQPLVYFPLFLLHTHAHTHEKLFPQQHPQQSLWWLPVMHNKKRWHLRLRRGHADKSIMASNNVPWECAGKWCSPGTPHSYGRTPQD